MVSPLLHLLLAPALGLSEPAATPQNHLAPKEEGVWFPLFQSEQLGSPQQRGGWLKQICARKKLEETCVSYVWGVIDSLETWGRETKHFLINRSYGEIIRGIRDYLETLSVEDAEKMGAPELIQRALEAQFPLEP